jgi:hypothetical protein
MPVEFWREVVDRINEEMPNTLLLAEAFWLMESYFVRTLGMHRVYNSAFMHMMMKEENNKYRKLIANTLGFNPEILKRYVNFMSNPDEETAINQFGKGDKYFGVAVMMVTLPGLPMFGHGQIEGFAEKYGMEYQRAYYDEAVDEHLIWRHKREIFPLLQMRHLFSQVEHFELYDFIDANEELNENVFAYSNKSGNETAFVIYNNSYNSCEGRIKYSNPKNHNDKVLQPRAIASIFNFKANPNYYYIYKDHRTQLQFLLSGREVSSNGFEINLFGYQYRICLNFKEVYDETGSYEKLYTFLNGRGVASVEETLHEMYMSPLHSAMEEFLALPNIGKIRDYIFHYESADKKIRKKEESQFLSSINEGLSSLVNELQNYNVPHAEKNIAEESFNNQLNSSKAFYDLWIRFNRRKTIPQWMMDANLLFPLNHENKDNEAVCVYSVFLTIDNLLLNGTNEKVNDYEHLIFSKPLIKIFNAHTSEDNSRSNTELIKSLLKFNNELNDIKIKLKAKRKEKKQTIKRGRSALHKLPFYELFKDENVSRFLKINEFGSITYFNKERFEDIIKWLYQFAAVKSFSTFEKSLEKAKEKKRETGKSKKQLNKQELERKLINSVKETYISTKKLIWLAEESGYDLTKFSASLIKIKMKSKNNFEKETHEN